jgi:hypothetical protein
MTPRCRFSRIEARFISEIAGKSNEKTARGFSDRFYLLFSLFLLSTSFQLCKMRGDMCDRDALTNALNSWRLFSLCRLPSRPFFF